MILLDAWKRRPRLPRAAMEKAPFVAAALVFGLIALDVQGGHVPRFLARADTHLKGTADSLDLTTAQRLVLPMYGNLMYIVRFFMPLGQSAVLSLPRAGDASRRRSAPRAGRLLRDRGVAIASRRKALG